MQQKYAHHASKQAIRASVQQQFSETTLSLLQQWNSQRFHSTDFSRSQLTNPTITVSSTVTNQPSQQLKTTLTFPFYRVRPSDAYAPGRGIQ